MIDRNEWREHIGALGLEPDEAALDALFSRLDVDKSGTLEPDEPLGRTLARIAATGAALRGAKSNLILSGTGAATAGSVANLLSNPHITEAAGVGA